jgi:hypothetical protein
MKSEKPSEIENVTSGNIVKVSYFMASSKLLRHGPIFYNLVRQTQKKESKDELDRKNRSKIFAIALLYIYSQTF